MDSRGGRDERNDKTRRRAAPGSTPSLRVFLPYVLLGAVIILVMLWIYVIGPAGESEDRGQLLHLEAEQEIEATAEGQDEVEVAREAEAE